MFKKLKRKIAFWLLRKEDLITLIYPDNEYGKEYTTISYEDYGPPKIPVYSDVVEFAERIKAKQYLVWYNLCEGNQWRDSYGFQIRNWKKDLIAFELNLRPEDINA